MSLILIDGKGFFFYDLYNSKLDLSGLSIGIAVLQGTELPDDLFKRADLNMYREKHGSGIKGG